MSESDAEQVASSETSSADRHVASTEESSLPPTDNLRHGITRAERTERWFEVIAGIMLALVAVATAWSVYQATRWAGVQSTDFAQAAARRVESTRDATLAGQLRLYDLVLVNNWLNAHYSGQQDLETVFESRMRPEFRPTFAAWLALDPFNNPNAPAGPLFMPQYASSLPTTADQLDDEADRIFNSGETAREQGDAYVLNTVFLAMVLFLTSVADRFRWTAVRAAVLGIGVVMLLFGVYHLIVYPIA